MQLTFLPSKIQQIEQAVEQTIETFADLNATQLNYKPDAKNWSIAQCLDHLMVTDNQYSETIKQLANKNYKGNMWTKIGILSSFFGKMLIKATAPIPDKKGKTISSFQPSSSDLPADILQKYKHHNAKWCELLSQLDGLDYANIRISSPAGVAITYSLEDLLTLLANHKERHYHQAVNVMNSVSFPK